MNAACNQTAFTVLFVEVQVCQTDCYGTCSQAFGNTNLAIQIDFRCRIILSSNCFVINQLSSQSGKCIDYLILVAGINTAAVGIKCNACIFAISLNCLINNNVAECVKACITVFTVFMCQICVYITGQVLNVDILRFLLINITGMSAVCTTIKIADIADNIVSAIVATSPIMRYSRHIIPNCTVTQIQIIVTNAVEMTFQIGISSVQTDINCAIGAIKLSGSRYISFNLQIIISGINNVAFCILLHIQVNQSFITSSPDRGIIMRNNAATTDVNRRIVTTGKQRCAILYINIYKAFNLNRAAVFFFSAVLSIYFNSTPVHLITRSFDTAANLDSMLLAIIIIDNYMRTGCASSSSRGSDSTAVKIVISRGNADSTGIINRNRAITVSADSCSSPLWLAACRGCFRESAEVYSQVMSLHIDSIARSALSIGR